MKQIRNLSNTEISGADYGQAWAEAKLHFADAFQALACSNSALDKASVPILASDAGVRRCGNRLSVMSESSQPPPLWRALREWSPLPTLLSVSSLSSTLSARNNRLLDYVSARVQIVGTEHQQTRADAKLFYADAYEALPCSQSTRDQASVTILASDAEVRKRGHPSGSLLDQSQAPPLWRVVHNWSPLPALEGVGSSPMTPTSQDGGSLRNSLAPPIRRDPNHCANSLDELFSWHDADFVRCAYVSIFGRQPAGDRESYYLSHLRTFGSKIKLLWQLLNSLEATQDERRVRGFKRALRKARLAKKPVIWRLLGFQSRSSRAWAVMPIHRPESGALKLLSPRAQNIYDKLK